MSPGHEGGRFRSVARAIRTQRDGADLRDHVVQQLSSVRLTLRAVEEVLGGGPLADRLREGIEELDDQVDGPRGRFVEHEEKGVDPSTGDLAHFPDRHTAL